jgi:glycosyltransferase involved in cell wall biosynthesis
MGGGCSVREALAAGLPVVSLSGRLTAEEKIITDNLPGLDFVAQEWEGLVDVLARLVDPETQRMASERSRLHFLEKQHAAVVMRRFEELLLQLHTP